MSEPDAAPIRDEELRASVSEFIARLSETTGVDIDLDEVWSHLMARKVDDES